MPARQGRANTAFTTLGVASLANWVLVAKRAAKATTSASRHPQKPNATVLRALDRVAFGTRDTRTLALCFAWLLSSQARLHFEISCGNLRMRLALGFPRQISTIEPDNAVLRCLR